MNTEVYTMSEREQLLHLIEIVPEYKIGYILAYVQGITADEKADDEFCQKLYQEYLEDDDPEKDDTFPLEDLKKEWGI